MSSDEIVVCRYSDDVCRAVLKMLGDDGTRERLWSWQFEQNPLVGKFDPVVVCKGGEAVGFNGTMPVKVMFEGQEREALWSCDFIVASELRGHGVGHQIKKALAEKSDLMMSFGMTPVAERVLVSSGWKASREVYSYRRISAPRSLREALMWLAQWAVKIPGFSQSCEKLDVVISSTLPSITELDALWSGVASTYQKVVVRDWAYMHWKYECHPMATYSYMVFRRQNKLLAVAVVRVSDGIARLVDYVGAGNSYSLKRAVVRSFLKAFSGAKTYVCTCSDMEFGDALQHEGVLRLRTQPRFCVYSKGTEIDMESGWFLMSGDSDGELLMAARGH